MPIVFAYCHERVTTDIAPDPFYLLASRCTYLPLVTTKVKKHLVANGVDVEDELWFEHQSQALQWHYPIGVLFDFYGSPSRLPWSITVHVRGFPEEEILRCPDMNVVENVFINAIKEADYIKNGSTKQITGLLEKDQRQLWLGLRNMKLEQFWSVNERLMTPADTEARRRVALLRWEGRRGVDLRAHAEHAAQHFKNVPFRMYLVDPPILSEPFAPFSPDGKGHTLGDLMKSMLPESFSDAEGSEPPQVIVHGECAGLVPRVGGMTPPRLTVSSRARGVQHLSAVRHAAAGGCRST